MTTAAEANARVSAASVSRDYSRTVRVVPDVDGRPGRGYNAVPDRWSTILGRPCAIMQPAGVPKAREECTPFTLTFSDSELKGLAYLGPWCPNCGKRGKPCKDRYGCLVRHITHR